MVYNEKYNRYFTKGGLVFRYVKKNKRLELVKLQIDKGGYESFAFKNTRVRVHRAIYETFVGEIPKGYEIDHINTKRDDNSVENLKLVTHKENMNNPLTINKIKELHANKEYLNKQSNSHKNLKHTEESKLKMRKPKSEFGVLFEEHYHITYGDDIKLYQKELMYYRRHKICSWEVDNECD